MRSGPALVLLEQIDAFLLITSRNPINAQSPLSCHASLLSPPSSPSEKDWVGLQASALLPPSSSSESISVVSNSLRPHGLYSPWNFLGQNTGVGSRSLLQGILPTQGSNPGLPHCRGILYQLSHKGSPRILEWVAYPLSRRASQPRNQTRVSCITGEFFTN